MSRIMVAGHFAKNCFCKLQERFSLIAAKRHLPSLAIVHQKDAKINEDAGGGCGGYVQNYINRNPRNLELLGMAKKPRGYATRLWRVDYYHRLMLDISSRHITGYVVHNNGLRVAEASTKEFCISRYLYKTCDVSASYNIGRVLAQRCKDMGLYRIMWEHKKDRSREKVKMFLKAFNEAGIILNEPKVRQTMPPPGQLPP
jgi:large subunit ribosomal protein L18